MTTCIVGNAAQDCGMLSYDEYSSFDKNDILDPEFPLTTETCGYERYVDRPEHVLMKVCHGLTPSIVNTIGEMEDSWMSGYNKVRDCNEENARRLWSYARGDAAVYIFRLYGHDSEDDFITTGDNMFN